MKDRPILFSGPMVRAILEGRKTQTRRVIPGRVLDKWTWHDHHLIDLVLRCPYGVPGDRLWVKEKHVLLDRDGWWDTTLPRDAIRFDGQRNGVAYADNEHDADSERCRNDYGYRWRPSIHMPRWASRITLEVVSVRVERLQTMRHDIRAFKAEGVTLPASALHPDVNTASKLEWQFIKLWNACTPKHPWSSSPFVWVVEFKRLEATK